MSRCSVCERWDPRRPSRTLCLDEKSVPKQDLDIYRVMYDLTRGNDSPLCSVCCRSVISQVREDLQDKTGLIAARMGILKNSVLAQCLSKDVGLISNDTLIGSELSMGSQRSESSLSSSHLSTADTEDLFELWQERYAPALNFGTAICGPGKQICMPGYKAMPTTGQSSSSSIATEDSVSLGSVHTFSLGWMSVNSWDPESGTTSRTQLMNAHEYSYSTSQEAKWNS